MEILFFLLFSCPSLSRTDVLTSIFGLMLQTWEDPTHIDKDTNAKGDNDPLDVCEIGQAVGFTGQIKQVKALGVMALLDEGKQGCHHSGSGLFCPTFLFLSRIIYRSFVHNTGTSSVFWMQ